jgi:hypothetical protein
MNSSIIRSCLLGAACLAAAPGPATAYEGEPTVRARAAVVRGDAPGAAGEKSHVFEIRTDNGKVTVRVDGKEIPADRLKVDGGRIIVLDENGKEIKGIGLFAATPGSLIGKAYAEADAIEHEHPAVMVGIHMDDPGEALQRHLRLEPGETSIVTAIFEGLPAHEAGIEQYDIIVAVDGKRPAGPNQVRESLADKSDGDTTVFTVIHEGKTVDRTVTLEAWDSERMKAATVIGAVGITTPAGVIHLPRDFKFERVFDPDSQQWFEWLKQSGLSDQIRAHLHDQLPSDIDSRLEHLNQRIDEIKELIDRLILQARDLAREPQRDPG